VSRHRHHGRQDGERGAASVLVLALAGMLVLLGAALSVVGAMVVDHRTAQSAADLAALAAAQTLADGGDACGAAARVAIANGAEPTACSVTGREVRVGVLVRGPRWLGQRGDLEAEARAGPA
jgi:secretion/DNA translocation related TadE-like protein